MVVYDLGGGTFDVSVLKITPGEGVSASVSQVSDFFQVLATSGDTHLGVMTLIRRWWQCSRARSVREVRGHDVSSWNGAGTATTGGEQEDWPPRAGEARACGSMWARGGCTSGGSAQLEELIELC